MINNILESKRAIRQDLQNRLITSGFSDGVSQEVAREIEIYKLNGVFGVAESEQLKTYLNLDY